MAEWSMAVDLRPTILGCAGSNPAGSKTKGIIQQPKKIVLIPVN